MKKKNLVTHCISPEKRSPETLKSCRFGRFRPKIGPENRFSSSRSVRRWVKPLTDTGTSPGKLLYNRSRRYSQKRVGIDIGNSPEKLSWERKRSLRAVRLERSGMGSERRFCLRLRTWSWVRAVSDSNEPWRLRSSRTSRETRSWRHETPVQLHGLLVEFQVVSFFALSVQAFNAKRGSKSGFFEAWEKRKWRMRRINMKSRRTYRLGFTIVVYVLTEVWVCVCRGGFKIILF